ncbi:MAG: serine/threonine-protein kinase [Fimbriiglobus sp.]|jgi:serine/threonine protein kinase|nr:serine/threonine-protein kinase [Fimbriiglobus sp.]
MTSDETNHHPPLPHSPPAGDLANATRTFAGDPGATVSLQFSQPLADRPNLWPVNLTRYRPLHRLGGGGMGEVFLAHDSQLDRPVAIKFPRLSRGGSTALILTEARAAARLHHPGICPVFDADVCDGVPYLTMAFVQGPTLAAELKRLGPCPPEYAAKLVRDVAEAMQYAHENGVIHRDLKPSNILLTADHSPVVTDFGLAVRLDREGLADGVVSGTPHYMAPEQATGDAANIGERTDVFALGVILFEMLTGRTPFDGNAREVLAQVKARAVPPLRVVRKNVPAELAEVVAKATARAPADRFTGMGEFADDLSDYLRNLKKPTRQFPLWLKWVLGVPALLLLGFVTLSCFFSLGLPAVQKLLLNPQSSGRGVVEDLLDKGGKLESEGRVESAMVEYTNAIEIDPDSVLARERRAELALKLEKFDLAVEDFTVLRRTNPNRADYHSGWGEAVFWREAAFDPMDPAKVAAALDAAELAIHKDPNHARGYLLRAEVYVEQKRYPEAETDASRGIELEPDNPLHWRTRAHARSLQGKEAASLADADHAAELEAKQTPPVPLPLGK